MKLAIGTKSPPKLRAIEQSSQDCVYFQGHDIEILSESVESGVSDMPISLDETILGAKNRAYNVSKLTEANFYIGMEGGTTIVGGKALLFGCIYIIDSNGKEHFGLSSMIEIPDSVQTRIYNNGEGLDVIITEMTGQIDAKKKSGAFGYFTEDMLTRKNQFSVAFITAISPFFNKYYK